MITHVKETGDVVSVGITIASLLSFLPAIAAGVTIIWTCIRIYETKTVQRFVLWIKKKRPV